MATIFVTQTYRPSRLSVGDFVRGPAQQFGAIKDALLHARAAADRGCRVEVSKVVGDVATDIWHGPILLKTIAPRPIEEAGCANDNTLPDQTICGVRVSDEPDHETTARHDVSPVHNWHVAVSPA